MNRTWACHHRRLKSRLIRLTPFDRPQKHKRISPRPEIIIMAVNHYIFASKRFNHPPKTTNNFIGGQMCFGRSGKLGNKRITAGQNIIALDRKLPVLIFRKCALG